MVVVTVWGVTKPLRVTPKVSFASTRRSVWMGSERVAMAAPVANADVEEATARIKPVVASTETLLRTMPADACNELNTSGARSVAS